MPMKHRRIHVAQQTDASLREALAAICRGSFLVVTAINMLLMTDYYLIFVTGTAHVQKNLWHQPEHSGADLRYHGHRLPCGEIPYRQPAFHIWG